MPRRSLRTLLLVAVAALTVAAPAAASAPTLTIKHVDTSAWPTVKVADGGVTVDDGDTGGDCTISTTSETFEKVVKGEQNPTAAYMSGKLKIKGDMGAAMKLQKLF